jgi:uncharacterized membrane protein
MASDDEIRQQLAELSARIASLEAAVQGMRGARPDPPAVATTAAVPPPPSRQAPPPVALKPAASPSASLETRIGAQLLNRVGILAVLIGVAWFLKLAFDRNWIGPPIRILVGLACAAGLVAWSERFRRRGFAAFSYSLKALGTGIAYLSLWAAFSVFHLASAGLIFSAMTAVTVANAVLAWRQDSELLALYALVGGLATPALLSEGHGSEIFLFSYLALLNAGALLLLALHPWKRLALGALLGTAAYYFGWTVSQAYPTHVPVTLFFLALFFAVFAAMPFLILRQARAPATDPFVQISFPILNAAATFLALMVLFADQHSGRPWVTVGLAIACLLLAARSHGPAAVALARTHLGLGILFVTVAIPLQFSGYVVTLCWLGEALVLVALAEAGSHAAMRLFGAMVLALAFWALFVDWSRGPSHPLAVVANMHFATSLIGAGVFAAVIRLSLGSERGLIRTYLAGFSAIAFSLTLLVSVSLEIHHYWFCGAGFFRDYCRGYGHFEERSVDAGFSYSAWCMLYGAALMTVGFLRRSAFLRWQALIVLALSIGMVFLNGIGSQSQGYRVLSFLALGVLLLGVSFAYQKDWLRLRG